MYIEIKILGGIGVKFIDLIPNICDGLPFEKGDFVLLNFWDDNEDLRILDGISENLSKKELLLSDTIVQTPSLKCNCQFNP